MKIPVILAARNEEQTIGGALDRLAEQHGQVEPIVVVNDTTDRTADIAIAMGNLCWNWIITGHVKTSPYTTP
jgi:glycosyltransferase involved in cell wall biosynthesis